MKGLLVTVYRDADGIDCTNGGVTSRVSKAVLCGEGLPELFEPSEDAPALLVQLRRFRGTEYVYALPADSETKPYWYMFGGNFVYSSDSRFHEAVCEYPIPVHDRRE